MEDLILTEFDSVKARFQVIDDGKATEYWLTTPPVTFTPTKRIENPHMKIVTSKKGTQWIKQILQGAQLGTIYTICTWKQELTKTHPIEKAAHQFILHQGHYALENTPYWAVEFIKLTQQLYPNDTIILEQTGIVRTLKPAEEAILQAMQACKEEVTLKSDTVNEFLHGPFMAITSLKGAPTVVLVSQEHAWAFWDSPYPGFLEWGREKAVEWLREYGKLYAFVEILEGDLVRLRELFGLWVEMLSEPFVDVGFEVLSEFNGRVDEFTVEIFLRSSEAARIKAIAGPQNQVRVFERLFGLLFKVGAVNVIGFFASWFFKPPWEKRLYWESARAFLKWLTKKKL